MNDARLQVAFGGSHPDRVSGLHADHGPVGTRRRLGAGAIKTTDRARRCTSYGRRIAEIYGRAIAGAGWPVVSGPARGIDGAAHQGTVAAGGVGIAILGSGIGVMYPRGHADLALDLMSAKGAVVSESPPGTPPEAWRFPPRNRTNTWTAQRAPSSVGWFCPAAPEERPYRSRLVRDRDKVSGSRPVSQDAHR